MRSQHICGLQKRTSPTFNPGNRMQKNKLNTIKEIVHSKQISKGKCMTVHIKYKIIIMFQKMKKDHLVINYK